MANNKKYKIITKLEDDAPHGDINWCTISFLSPQKIEKIKYIDVKGFKVHNGYNTAELAHDDAKKIKDKNKNHDVYMSQLGKIYAWDDATKTDSVEYDDEKLNELEKTRRENIDKIKLMSEQFKNEYKTVHANTNSERVEASRKRMQEKLYQKGLITKEEYELIKEVNKPMQDIKEIAESMEKIKVEMEESFKTDYLDENESVGLKYGCMTIYSPKHIGGLKTLCFKVRGLFQTPSELNKRVRALERLYPNDRIYKFEIGKWCAYSENDNADPMELLKQLNYTMKCHLENLEHEKEEFEKRKEKMQSQTEQESKLTKARNRAEKRKEKREAAKRKKAGLTDKLPEDEPVVKENKLEPVSSLGNTVDDVAIQNVINFLDDPELRDKFPADRTTTQAVDIN
ncbi:hypothetical protein QJ856_gp0660 [Tupanvirus deep ocean]|uniref:Uncharacterized protein n=2 Tax=Tupanvirus TaxID=2094720 RepID=A0AC62A8I8_9VIRU|nr:hypothetical protein QJ856_gp0660 [Tupanvirus deep ocean]QKU34090.1 hypothetical protein [Tupanvirus deep ocean]